MLTNLIHSYKAYELLPSRNKPSLKVNEQRLYSVLSDDFTRSQAVLIGETISIKERTVDSCLKTFREKDMVDVSGKGEYKKKQ